MSQATISMNVISGMGKLVVTVSKQFFPLVRVPKFTLKFGATTVDAESHQVVGSNYEVVFGVVPTLGTLTFTLTNQSSGQAYPIKLYDVTSFPVTATVEHYFNAINNLLSVRASLILLPSLPAVPNFSMAHSFARLSDVRYAIDGGTIEFNALTCPIFHRTLKRLGNDLDILLDDDQGVAQKVLQLYQVTISILFVDPRCGEYCIVQQDDAQKH